VGPTGRTCPSVGGCGGGVRAQALKANIKLLAMTTIQSDGSSDHPAVFGLEWNGWTRR